MIVLLSCFKKIIFNVIIIFNNPGYVTVIKWVAHVIETSMTYIGLLKIAMTYEELPIIKLR
jgi:hypothetical protein